MATAGAGLEAGMVGGAEMGFGAPLAEVLADVLGASARGWPEHPDALPMIATAATAAATATA